LGVGRPILLPPVVGAGHAKIPHGLRIVGLWAIRGIFRATQLAGSRPSRRLPSPPGLSIAPHRWCTAGSAGRRC